MEYLVDETLMKLDDEWRSTLLTMSLLDRFSGDLLQEAVLSSPEPDVGAAILRSLVRANLFLIPLDEQGVWYRFHHLFQEMLRHRLKQESTLSVRQAVYHKASIWYERQGLLEEAIAHALLAADHQRAVALVEQNLHVAMNAEDWRRIDRWLGRLPVERTASPGILVAAAVLEHFRHHINATADLIEKAAALIEQERQVGQGDESRRQEWSDWLGAVYVFRAQHRQFLGEADACIHFATEALTLLPQDWRFLRALAEFYRISGLQQAGRSADAVRYARQRLEEQRSSPDQMTLRIFLGLGAIYHSVPDTFALEQLTPAFIQLSSDLDRPISLGWAHYLRGWTLYQSSRVGEAEHHFRAVVQEAHRVHLRAAIDSYTGLALTLAARGDFGEAKAAVDSMSRYIADLNAINLMPIAASLKTRLRLMEGERVRIPVVNNLAGQLTFSLWEVPALTTVRGILTSGEAARLPEADEILTDCRARAATTYCGRVEIEVGLLTTMYYAVQDNIPIALRELRDAVKLAAPAGMTQPFREMGPRLHSYLSMLSLQAHERTFIRQVLATSSPEHVTDQTKVISDQEIEEWATILPPEQLRAELTHRELEVLLLLAQQRTDAEIADALVITHATVKKHAGNIYRKLGVKNRRQAVASARVAGILPLAQ